MLFYINQLISEPGTLDKVWLAAFWQAKVTKADVLQCNVESTVKEIESLKLNIGMRTYGHLLLGVVRILSRKAEYLQADSSEALVKINMTFRPGLPGAPANAGAMTLTEDFTWLDSSPSEMSDSDFFSRHQSRPEEITLEENLGNNFLNFVVSGTDLTFPSLAVGEDGFGDEGNEHELLAFLESCSDHAVDFLHKEQPEQNSKNLSLHENQVLPGAPANAGAMTLTEDFTWLDSSPSEMSDSDFFSRHQSRPEEITLEENLGNNFLSFVVSGTDLTFPSLAVGEDGFGDEGNEHELLAFLESCSDHAVDFLHKEQPEQNSKNLSLHENQVLPGAPANAGAMTLTQDFTWLDSSLSEMSDSDFFSRHQSRPEEITLEGTDLTFPSLAVGEDGFGDEGNEHELLAFLESCSDQAVDFFHKKQPEQNSKNLSLHENQVSMEEKKRLRRKRMLVVDHVKELSRDTIRKQIVDYSDLLAPMEMAPPTRTLMQWMEHGSANNLFSQMCTSVNSSTIKEFFSRCLMMESPDVDFGVEEIHQEKLRAAEQREDNSVLSSLGDSPPLTMPELSEDSLSVQPSAEPPDTLSTQQSAVNYQEFVDRRITQRVLRIHRLLKSCNAASFSFMALCAGNNRAQAAGTFSSLLVLQQLEVVRLYQYETYGDIQITPGPRF